MAVIIEGCVDRWGTPYTTGAFITGAATSMLCGSLGMKIATFANHRTASCARYSLGSAFNTAFRAACAIGFTLVSLALLILISIILVYKFSLGLEDWS